MFNYLNKSNCCYYSNCIFCFYYFGVSRPANIQVQICDWCVHFFVVVIPSSVQIHCFELLLPFFLGFTQEKLSPALLSNSTKTPPVTNTNDIHITKFNGEFSFLILLKLSALCDVVAHFLLLQTILLDSLVFLLPELLASYQTPLQVPSHLPVIFVLLWESFYRPLFYLYSLPQ